MIPMEILGFLAMLIGCLLDPVHLIIPVLVGLLSSSLLRTIGISTALGVAITAFVLYFTQQISESSPVMMVQFAQVISFPLFASVCYGLKRAWIRLQESQKAMDETQAYLSEMIDPSLVEKPEKTVAPEPIKYRPTTAGVKAMLSGGNSQGKTSLRLNLIQRIILSAMTPVLTVIVLKSLTYGLSNYPYNINDPTWIWLGGLGSLTWFEVWIWRDRT